ncbi:pyridoxal kinase [Methylocella silvestris BL2]|uniref:pyridoxal kinase n=1 Tax=Methylocella silvestris (strain DSM 15510 / CIP 108128 / LMG 27833 / NCIMB 13906 / BL2) TaxID=395965 RepID=B8EQU6_METSB|nr:pyridoxal kinase [Methylocella silvestris]ACK49367.1 pyridoxal kinase [Methylocella silvestris BL2]
MPYDDRQREPPPALGKGPRIISIQSQVVHGSVGHNAALFPMQALGVAVAAVPTTLLSNHPRYPTLRGRVLDAPLVADLLLGVAERGLIEASSILLTGYLGSAEIGAVVGDFVDRAKARNPQLAYLCDPVIGDDEPGVFVAPGLVDLIRDRLVPAAAILTPNQFELEILAGAPARDIYALRRAAALISARGPGRVVVTGCALADTPRDCIETVVCESDVIHRIATVRLPIRPNGAGDLFAGLLAAHLARGRPLIAASESAARGVSSVLARTLAEGSYELRIVAEDILS